MPRASPASAAHRARGRSSPATTLARGAGGGRTRRRGSAGCMSEKRRTARASEPDSPRITRRALMELGVAALAALMWPRRGRAALEPGVTRLLESSGFVYVCPLRSDGNESECHGEVWYGWLDGDVVLITAK